MIQVNLQSDEDMRRKGQRTPSTRMREKDSVKWAAASWRADGLQDMNGTACSCVIEVFTASKAGSWQQSLILCSSGGAPDEELQTKAQLMTDLKVRVSAEVQVSAVVAAGADHISQHIWHAGLLQDSMISHNTYFECTKSIKNTQFVIS